MRALQPLGCPWQSVSATTRVQLKCCARCCAAPLALGAEVGLAMGLVHCQVSFQWEKNVHGLRLHAVREEVL